MTTGVETVASWSDAALDGRGPVDELTQLAGGWLFRDRLVQAMARQRREGRSVAVIAIEVLGVPPREQGGTAAVVALADRLSGVLRAGDTLARLDDSWFGAIVDPADDRAEALSVAARLAASFDRPFDIRRGEPVTLSAAVGLAIFTGHEAVEHLVRQAESALHAAKASGTNRIDLFEPGRSHGPEEGVQRVDPGRAEVEAILRFPSDLAIVMQPILDLRTGSVAGYEALARFGDEGRPPDEWFALAHRCGLGPQLEALAVRTALGVGSRPAGTYLSVNASPSAIVSKELWDVLPERLDGLVFEVTEHEVIPEEGALDAAIAGLRHRGALLAVDDAGSGYAGLQQLMRLAPDLIKLDRALIGGIDLDPVKAALVNAIVRFAESINATVCAEGIERPQELNAVAELGITYGQGYFIARPAPPWSAAADQASSACRYSVEDALRSTGDFESQATDRRMAAIASAAASIQTRDDAIVALDLISREMNAEHVCLSAIIDDGRAVQTIISNESFDGGKVFPLDTHPLTAHVLHTGEMVQVRVADPEADLSELAWMLPDGFNGLLMAPIGPASCPVALLEICCRAERPWNRAEIYRARVICQLLAPSVQRLLT